MDNTNGTTRTTKTIKIRSYGYCIPSGEPYQVLLVDCFFPWNVQCIIDINNVHYRFIKNFGEKCIDITDVSKLSEEEFFQLSLVWDDKDVDLYELLSVQRHMHRLISYSRIEMTYEEVVVL